MHVGKKEFQIYHFVFILLELDRETGRKKIIIEEKKEKVKRRKRFKANSYAFVGVFKNICNNNSMEFIF